ncbi:YciI family protein [Roseinatronobacter alkalisoli]|uniref:YciI family protein n=1 Tax=Roseinatronobacter alkalisoli TaxID=3028235 RepID=A0ABT5TAC6_9RHOB|nr:YciI family protein [Roseinatronobacter sp. HJB301]MDD7972057.1 YciI family protein [Roseinatronobacter sp. HJB301]
MFFLMICKHHDRPETAALRDELRPQHRDWVASGGGGLAVVLTGSAIWDDAGQGTGNFGILQADNEARARAFAEGDPFFSGGVVQSITLTRLADTFRADRITPLTGG